jgi:hypothetical protein
MAGADARSANCAPRDPIIDEATGAMQAGDPAVV